MPIFLGRGRYEGGFGRIQKGDRVSLAFAAAPGADIPAIAGEYDIQTLGVSLDVVYDDGEDGELFIPPVAMSALAITTRAVAFVPGSSKTDQAKNSGTITGGLVTGNLAGIPRGALCTVIATRQGSGAFRVWGKGYSYNTHPVVVGEMGEWGPGGGNGFYAWHPVFHNAAGNAAEVNHSLAATNAFRMVYGVTYYYHADATVIDRTMFRPLVIDPGGAKPTGFTITGLNALYSVTASADPVLSANEEGAIIAISRDGRDGKMVSNDNGNQTIASSATEPTPFPMAIDESDLTRIRFRAATNGQAGDTHSAYVFQEEWVSP